MVKGVKLDIKDSDIKQILSDDSKFYSIIDGIRILHNIDYLDCNSLRYILLYNRRLDNIKIVIIDYLSLYVFKSVKNASKKIQLVELLIDTKINRDFLIKIKNELFNLIDNNKILTLANINKQILYYYISQYTSDDQLLKKVKDCLFALSINDNDIGILLLDESKLSDLITNIKDFDCDRFKK